MALSKLANRRLTKLVEFMESLPRTANKHFDMKSWFNHDGDHQHADIKSDAPLQPEYLHKCGTTACAAGWAATIPSFRRQGFKLIVDPEERWGGRIEYRDSTDPLTTFFAIDDGQAADLFGGSNEDKTPKAWARRARKLIKEWDAA